MKHHYLILLMVLTACASTKDLDKLQASQKKTQKQVVYLQTQVTDEARYVKETAERLLDENDKLTKRVQFQGQLIGVLERRADSLEATVRRIRPVKEDIAKAEALMREFMAYTKRRDSSRASVLKPEHVAETHPASLSVEKPTVEAAYSTGTGYVYSEVSTGSRKRYHSTAPRTQYVSGYTRRSKSGKVTYVQSYHRSRRRR